MEKKYLEEAASCGTHWGTIRVMLVEKQILEEENLNEYVTCETRGARIGNGMEISREEKGAAASGESTREGPS